MKIEITENKNKSGWVVSLDSSVVNFSTREDAQLFADRLRARLDAPHCLPTTAPGLQVD